MFSATTMGSWARRRDPPRGATPLGRSRGLLEGLYRLDRRDLLGFNGQLDGGLHRPPLLGDGYRHLSHDHVGSRELKVPLDILLDHERRLRRRGGLGGPLLGHLARLGDIPAEDLGDIDLEIIRMRHVRPWNVEWSNVA
jgi:hypothetical protein